MGATDCRVAAWKPDLAPALLPDMAYIIDIIYVRIKQMMLPDIIYKLLLIYNIP